MCESTSSIWMILQPRRRRILVFISDSLSLYSLVADSVLRVLGRGSATKISGDWKVVVQRSTRDCSFCEQFSAESLHRSLDTTWRTTTFALIWQFVMYLEAPFMFFCARETMWHERFLYILSALILDTCELPTIRTSTSFGALPKLGGGLAEVISGCSGSRWFGGRRGFSSSLAAEHSEFWLAGWLAEVHAGCSGPRRIWGFLPLLIAECWRPCWTAAAQDSDSAWSLSLSADSRASLASRSSFISFSAFFRDSRQARRLASDVERISSVSSWCDLSRESCLSRLVFVSRSRCWSLLHRDSCSLFSSFSRVMSHRDCLRHCSSFLSDVSGPVPLSSPDNLTSFSRTLYSSDSSFF